MSPLEKLREALDYDPATGIFRWRFANHHHPIGGIATHNGPRGYLATWCDGKIRPAHRVAWFYVTGEWPTGQIDHINRERADNRWANLRPATAHQNKFNRSLSRNNRSGVTGVDFLGRLTKWRAQIRIDGHCLHLGVFPSFDEAVAARKAAEEKHFGEFSIWHAGAVDQQGTPPKHT